MMRTRATRSLFGPTDHVQVQKDLKEELKKISQEGKRKWNFDFEKESPLEGRFEWFPVSPKDEEIPSFYSKQRCFKRRRSDSTEKSPLHAEDSLVSKTDSLLDMDLTHSRLCGAEISAENTSRSDDDGTWGRKHRGTKEGALSVVKPCSVPLGELELCRTPKRPCMAKNRVRVFSFSDDETSQDCNSLSSSERPKYKGAISTKNDKRSTEHSGIISAGER